MSSCDHRLPKNSGGSVLTGVAKGADSGPVRNGLDPHNEAGKGAIYPTPGSLMTYQLPPFQAAVDAGTSSIMSYYNAPNNERSAPQLPPQLRHSEDQQFEEVGAAYNDALVTGLLRGEMGFTGYVNSDSGALTERPWGVEDLSLSERYAKAVKAGTDLFSDRNDPSGLLDAVNTDLLEENHLNQSVKLLLTEMFQLGLFEDPYTDPDRAQRIATDPASQAKANEAHRKSIALLRNDRGLLPFRGDKADNGKLFVEVVAGENAAQRTEALKDTIRE